MDLDAGPNQMRIKYDGWREGGRSRTWVLWNWSTCCISLLWGPAMSTGHSISPFHFFTLFLKIRFCTFHPLFTSPLFLPWSPSPLTILAPSQLPWRGWGGAWQAWGKATHPPLSLVETGGSCVLIGRRLPPLLPGARGLTAVVDRRVSQNMSSWFLLPLLMYEIQSLKFLELRGTFDTWEGCIAGHSFYLQNRPIFCRTIQAQLHQYNKGPIGP